MRSLALAWALLVPLALAGIWLGNHAASALLPVASILLLALGKAWLIVLRFMELGHGPALWRRLLLGWPLALAVLLLAVHASY